MLITVHRAVYNLPNDVSVNVRLFPATKSLKKLMNPPTQQQHLSLITYPMHGPKMHSLRNPKVFTQPRLYRKMINNASNIKSNVLVLE